MTESAEPQESSKSTALASTAAPRPPKAGITLVRDPGKTAERQIADLVTAGIVGNAETAFAFTARLGDMLSVQQGLLSFRDMAATVAGGDLRSAEEMLAAQAVTLNAIFTDLALRAAQGLNGNLQRVESFMRMALKAQSQSRCTVETLAAIKQGPAIFAKQANIANGGPQQVNNGVAAMPASARPVAAAGQPAVTGARKNAKPVKTQLLEANHGERLDFGAARTAGRTDSDVAAVGVVDRPTDAGRQGEVGHARRQGRVVEAGARSARRPARGAR